MRILGISAFYHDSAAALIEDGRIVAAAQEERFTRKKYDARFPRQAIAYCLQEGRARIDQIDYVAFYEKPFLKFERLLETYLCFAPRGFKSFRMAMQLWLHQKLFQKRLLERELKSLGDGVDIGNRLLFAEHHQSHAASAFFASPFKEAAILTLDGVGEWTTSSAALGQDTRLETIKEIYFPHSLGLLYSAFTYYTGFKVNSGEYKVMGLAPYGVPRYRDLILEKLIDLKEDGSFRLDLSYFDYCVGLRMTNAKFDGLFGGPPRNPEDRITQREMDLAASIQAVTEEVLLRLTRSLAAYHLFLGQPRRLHGLDQMAGSYLGPSFEQDDIERRLQAVGARFEVCDSETLIGACVHALTEEKALGWFQGRMEFGPRALGCRSILGDPRSPTMQRTLNLKVKYRESFRPFAPSVLREELLDWFELDCDSPYMLLVAAVNQERRRSLTPLEEALTGIDKLNTLRSEIPAVTHVDYSARIQTVHRETNPRYHALLSAFKTVTGCAVLVNTSFNVRGEPIVCTPEDAFRCFMGTEIEALAIGNCFLRKEAQDPSLKLDYRGVFDDD